MARLRQATIATAHSWISTSEAITQAGGRVVFCDTDATFTILSIQPNREDPALSKINIAVAFPGQESTMRGETLIAEASIKPYINLVWLGTVTLVVGFVVTIVRRVRESFLTAPRP